jgi:hypothetical protein
LPEQQTALPEHWLPSVPQVAPGTGAHMPPVQVPLQQSLGPEHMVPLGRQTKPQVPAAEHDRPQQSEPFVQAPPWGVQLPPVAMQVWVVVSQAPEQQLTPVEQLPLFGVHDIMRMLASPAASRAPPSLPPPPLSSPQAPRSTSAATK